MASGSEKYAGANAGRASRSSTAASRRTTPPSRRTTTPRSGQAAATVNGALLF